ncbi:hypothetical protein Sjap_006959 [Stephania japonica]|uniref:Uncharacterized protein n=1 Tax=Stephania japonica TaxID=461633 RepID=A0AAP0PNB9_9MAGN
MVVLDHVFGVCLGSIRKQLLAKVALRFFNPLMPRDKDILEKIFDRKSHHLLDLFYSSFCGDFLIDNAWKMSWKQFQTIPSAIELKCAGVKVVRCENAMSLLDIRFNKGVRDPKCIC